MNDNQFNRRPTPEEKRAFVDVRQHFAEHLNQFQTSQAAVRHLEQNLAEIARTATMATARTAPGRKSFQTDDGSQWKHGVDLMDNIAVCYRPTSEGSEIGVLERLPSGLYEVLAKGHNAVDTLRSFARDQRQALHLWTEDVAVKVQDYLAEKYPGQNLSRVADGIMQRFTDPISPDESHKQTQKRGMRI